MSDFHHTSGLAAAIHNAWRLLLAGLLISLILSCDQKNGDVDPAAPVPEQLNVTQERSAAARVDLDGVDLAEAIYPFGMLRLHPAIAPGGQWLGLRHARSSEGVDFDVRWTPDQVPDASTLAIRGGPGWFNIDAAGQQKLQASAGPRSAHYRLQPPLQSALTLRLAWRDFGELRGGTIEPARGRRSISGSFTGRGGETLHVLVRFSRAFQRARHTADGSLEITFDQTPDPLEFALALSTVDVNGARENLGSSDVPDFGQMQRRARDSWNALLGRLDVSGEEALRRRAYLALYRLLAEYGDITDSDGQYRAASQEIRSLAGGQAYFGNLLPAQNYRTVIPFLSLLEPGRMADLFATITAHQRASGVLPQQTVWGQSRPSDELEPAVPVIASLVSRQLPDVKATQALPPLLKAFLPGAGDSPWADYEPRGYFSFQSIPSGSVSRSLAAGLAHQSTAAVAAALGEQGLAESFAVRTLFYRQLYDPQEQWFRGRDDERNWRTPFQPENAGPGSQDFAGRDPWAALWSIAQFDMDGLLSLLGGRQELTLRLDDFFDLAPGGAKPGQLAERGGTNIGAYEAGSPAHWHVPWLYPLSNEPAHGQQISRFLFKEEPPLDMTAGRAAWELFNLLGFYPVMPTRGDYILGLPRVASASLEIGENRLFIEAPGLSPGHPEALATGAKFNGARLPGFSVSHRRLAGGGTLEFLLPENQEPAE